MKEFIREVVKVLPRYLILCILVLLMLKLSEPNEKVNNNENKRVDDNVESVSTEKEQVSIKGKKITISNNGISIGGQYEIVVPKDMDEKQVGLELNKIEKSEEVKKTVIEEIEALRSGNAQIVYKWYGKSDLFTPEFIGSTASRVIVNFVDNDVTSACVKLHLCSVQNDLVEEEMRKLAEVESDKTEISNKVAQKIIDGEFNRCYNVTISTGTDGIIPTEELKVVMSGNAYKTVEVTPVECMIEHEEEELKYE